MKLSLIALAFGLLLAFAAVSATNVVRILLSGFPYLLNDSVVAG